MRFGTKILLLTLAITLSLSGIVILVVTRTVTRAETARAHVLIQRRFDEYGRSLDRAVQVIRRTTENLTGDSNVRAYLHELEESGPNASDEARAQLQVEIFGRTLQTELAKDLTPPAFHVLIDSRGRVLLVSAADMRAGSEDDVKAIERINWPQAVLLEKGEVPPLFVAIGAKLYAAFGVPLSIAFGEPPTIAYFVGFEVDDNWVRTVAGEANEPRVVIQLNGRTIAHNVPDAAAEQTLGTITSGTEGGAGGLDFDAHGENFIGAYQLKPAGASAYVFALYSSLDEALRPLRRLQWIIVLLTVGGVALSIIVSQRMSRMLARPIEQLVAGTERVARGDFTVKIQSDRNDELGQLARSFNHMAAGLEQRDLIKDTFGKFVDPKIVESMLSDPRRLKLGGERRVQSVLFADLANFTTLSEKLSPENLFRLLNGYLEDAADLVSQTHGIVDKFIGDGVVAFWGPPLETNHAAAACAAGLGFVRRASAHDALCRELGVPALRVRVGIATGELLVGNIGSKSKYNYTVMGDVANLASRLEGVNKLYGTQILVGAQTAQEAGPRFVKRKIDTVRVVGRREPVDIYEILGETGSVDGEVARRRADYAHAMELYSQRRWDEARAAFERMNDPPATAMAGRCAVLAENEPGATWDGVWNLDRK